MAVNTRFDHPACRVCGKVVDRRDACPASSSYPVHGWCAGGPDCALCGEPTAPSGHARLEGDPLHGRPAHVSCALVYPRRLAGLPAVEALCDGIAAACVPMSPERAAAEAVEAEALDEARSGR